MNPYESQAPQSGFGIQDVLYVIFKHKWKILLCSLLGFAAAAAVFVTRKPSYESDAKMLVRYVIERSAVDPYESREDPGTRSDGNVINTEIEILTSWDLAVSVAQSVGVDRLMKEAPEKMAALTKEEKENGAAAGILKSLKVTSPKGSNVIHVSYGNPEPSTAVEVLRELVRRYCDKHLEIHRSIGAFDMVAKQADQARSRLRETEGELNRMKAESGIMSLEGSTNAMEAQRTKVREALMMAEAEMVEQRARIESLEAILGKAEQPESTAAVVTPPDAVAVSDYAAIVERVRVLRVRRMDLLSKYTESNRQVALLGQQIGECEAQRRNLLKKYPGLVLTSSEGGSASVAPKIDMAAEKARYAAVLAKVDALKAQMAEWNQKSEQFSSIASKIVELERRKQLEEEKYRYLNTSLEKARTDEALDPSKMPNISMVQNPSAPVKTYDKLTKKLIAGLAGAGAALGLGLAFLLEMVIDRRIKRPIEIEARLQVPLMLSIPYVRPRDRGELLLVQETQRLSYHGDSAYVIPQGGQFKLVRSSDEDAGHFVMPYAEAIRDRLLFNFAVNNINHKPKLIGFTSLSSGAGTSTLAAGLAKSLAETEGVKVLLVDLNRMHGEMRESANEPNSYSLHGALALAKSDRFRGRNQGIYFASAAARRNGHGPTTFMPKHLHDLLPQFHASDFDYVIFDLPPVDQTSPSLVMAGLMDKVLLVLDAENNSREELKWGYTELVKNHADVSCVFNKARLHAPRWVAGEVV